jgi:putative sugar O-methyltransferase
MKKTIDKILSRANAPKDDIRTSTSLSDNQAYPQACLDAANDYRLFNEFRRHPAYNAILEHVTESQGADYLRLLSQDPDLLGRLETFRANDRHGNPRVFDYPGVGTVSPTTLRYVKVLADLRRLFGALDGLDLAEIGVGYGGQCRVIHAWFAPASYTLVDIQPALALAQRFLDHFALDGRLVYRTMNELAPKDHDLLLSNYAFTELPRAIQDVYVRKVVSRSKRGYITYNEITPPEFRSYKAQELVEMIPGAHVLNEEPLTHPLNCIIVWGGEK